MPTILKVRLTSGKYRRCDTRCHQARGPKCMCLCQGRYHGAGRNGNLLAQILNHQDNIISELSNDGVVLQAVLPLKGLLNE